MIIDYSWSIHHEFSKIMWEENSSKSRGKLLCVGKSLSICYYLVFIGYP